MRNVAAAIIALALGVGSTTAAPSVSEAPIPKVVTIDITDTVKKTFKVERGGELEIEADRGNVEVRNFDGDEVRITVERTVSVDSEAEAKEILELHKLDMSKKGDAVIVSSRVEERRFKFRNWRGDEKLRIRIIVEIPTQFDVVATTAAGNVDVDGLEGELDIRSGAGNVTIGDVHGEVAVITGSGNVVVGTVVGPVTVHSGAGNVELRAAASTTEISTGAGDITAYIAQQPSDDSEFATGAGNVTVYLADDIGVYVEAMARGNCTTDFPLQVEGRWMLKKLEGELNGGGPELAMKSGIGNVSLMRMRGR